jgi:hypothetical protein
MSYSTLKQRNGKSIAGEIRPVNDNFSTFKNMVSKGYHSCYTGMLSHIHTMTHTYIHTYIHMNTLIRSIQICKYPCNIPPYQITYNITPVHNLSYGLIKRNIISYHHGGITGSRNLRMT